MRQQTKQVDRRRSARAAGARTTQLQATAAAAHSGRRRHHLTAYVLWAVAAVLGILDLLVYTESVSWLSTDGANVLLGLPAAMFAIVGGIAYGT